MSNFHGQRFDSEQGGFYHDEISETELIKSASRQDTAKGKHIGEIVKRKLNIKAARKSKLTL